MKYYFWMVISLIVIHVRSTRGNNSYNSVSVIKSRNDGFINHSKYPGPEAEKQLRAVTPLSHVGLLEQYAVCGICCSCIPDPVGPVSFDGSFCGSSDEALCVFYFSFFFYFSTDSCLSAPLANERMSLVCPL